MNPWRWLVSLSPHELAVLQTVAICIGSGIVPVLALLLGWGVKLLRAVKRDAEKAREQTAHTEYIDGKQHAISVVDYARHAVQAGHDAAVSGAATRQEVSDLAGWVKGPGRRRQPTNTISIEQESHYE